MDTGSIHRDSRSVFIIYLIILVVFYIIYSLSDIVEDYGTGITISDIIKKSVKKLQIEWPKFVEARVEQNRREQGERDSKYQHLEISEQILRINNETSIT